MPISVESESDVISDVILLTGFLGAGKTTLLKRILSWETDLSDTVVMVNEFGDAGIDGALLKAAGTDVVEMNSGCICCTMSADLTQSLKRIYDQFRPARILIESSGVADPTAIAEILASPDFNRKLTQKKVIAVLDSIFWEGREIFGPLFYNQLEMGDLILLNKIDLLEATDVPIFLKEIHDTVPNAQVVPTIQCRVDPDTLWSDPNAKGVRLKTMGFYKPSSGRESVAADQYTTFSFTSSKRFDEFRFKQFIETLPPEMFRMKGPARLADRTVMVNYVGGQNEWASWKENDTQLAFIGWRVDQNKTLDLLKQCQL